MKEEKNEKKINRCMFSHMRLTGDRFCVEAGWREGEVTAATEETCEACGKFKSRYIEYPLTINGIDTLPISYEDTWHAKVGSLVCVRPCGEEYGKKTYLGFYLGDLPRAITHSFNEKTGILKAGTLTNPALFVPSLGKIIWGCGSYWKAIESEEDFKKITDEDINGQWYVQFVRKLQEAEDREGGEP